MLYPGLLIGAVVPVASWSVTSLGEVPGMAVEWLTALAEVASATFTQKSPQVPSKTLWAIHSWLHTTLKLLQLRITKVYLYLRSEWQRSSLLSIAKDGNKCLMID